MNPYERMARERKASAIATRLLVIMPDVDVEDLAGKDQDERDAIASWAREKTPSNDTWALVCQKLREAQGVSA